VHRIGLAAAFKKSAQAAASGLAGKCAPERAASSTIRAIAPVT